ncbi:hypothetical protein G6F53_014305 [Rhizopus delemar]|nr:hypothetical protein G6F53_014305 [Rhizopus delemar]
MMEAVDQDDVLLSFAPMYVYRSSTYSLTHLSAASTRLVSPLLLVSWLSAAVLSSSNDPPLLKKTSSRP